MKLSKRLKKIDDMVTGDYDHIWDCCCDHGFLGATLLNRQAAAHIHFVDIVPQLIQNLTAQLQQFYPNPKSAWYTHCLDVTNLPLDHYSGKHLIIIAGIGGDLMTTLISALHEKFTCLSIDFLICPVYQQYAVRKQLNILDLLLLDEALIEENQRFYEVILLSNQASMNGLPTSISTPLKQVSLVGDKIWYANTKQQQTIAQQYLYKTRQHYQRMFVNQPDVIQPIIDNYNAVKIKALF